MAARTISKVMADVYKRDKVIPAICAGITRNLEYVIISPVNGQLFFTDGCTLLDKSAANYLTIVELLLLLNRYNLNVECSMLLEDIGPFIALKKGPYIFIVCGTDKQREMAKSLMRFEGNETHEGQALQRMIVSTVLKYPIRHKVYVCTYEVFLILIEKLKSQKRI